MLFGNLSLTLFNNLVNELDNFTGLRTNHMVVMIIASHLEHSMTTLEIMPQHQAGRLKLGQNPVDSRQTHVISLIKQLLINVLSTEMVLFRVFQNVEDFHSRQSNLQADFS